MIKLILSASRTIGFLALVAGLSSVCQAAPRGGVPEIDPGSMASALTLLSGGFLLLSGRKRRK